MPAFLVTFAGFLFAGFARGIGEGLIRLLGALGIGFLTYHGVDTLLHQAVASIFTNLNSLPFAHLLGVLKVDKCLNVIASAWAIRLTLSTAGGGAKMVLKE